MSWSSIIDSCIRPSSLNNYYGDNYSYEDGDDDGDGDANDDNDEDDVDEADDDDDGDDINHLTRAFGQAP